MYSLIHLPSSVNFYRVTDEKNHENARNYSMLWDDPWIEAALSEGGTDLPPLPLTLPAHLTFSCAPASAKLCTEWATLVGTVWSVEQLAERLSDAWICTIHDDGRLVATCVLRPRDDVWLIETFVSRQRGCGSLLIRAMGPWLWKHVGGRFTLGYSWELTLPQILYAWWRGWLRTVTSIKYGWVLRLDPGLDGKSPCKFCPLPLLKQKPTTTMPFLVQTAAGSAVITDSGLGDGWGYVLKQVGAPDWSLIHARFGFHSLWCSSPAPPLACAGVWRWTGEFIVTGFLNKRSGRSDYEDWITSEVAFTSST